MAEASTHTSENSSGTTEGTTATSRSRYMAAVSSMKPCQVTLAQARRRRPGARRPLPQLARARAGCRRRGGARSAGARRPGFTAAASRTCWPFFGWMRADAGDPQGARRRGRRPRARAGRCRCGPRWCGRRAPGPRRDDEVEGEPRVADHAVARPAPRSQEHARRTSRGSRALVHVQDGGDAPERASTPADAGGQGVASRRGRSGASPVDRWSDERRRPSASARPRDRPPAGPRWRRRMA